MDETPAILIIDNDDDLVDAIATRLRHNGYECLTAATGAQGVAMFAERPVQLIITDLNMPSGDGISVVEQIRQGSNVPIIVVTGFGKAYRERLRQLPHVSCLRKPFDAEVLLDLVETELALAGADVPQKGVTP